MGSREELPVEINGGHHSDSRRRPADAGGSTREPQQDEECVVRCETVGTAFTQHQILVGSKKMARGSRVLVACACAPYCMTSYVETHRSCYRYCAP